MSESKTVLIPGPRGVPLLGNIYDIEQEVPLRSINLMADQYGTFPRRNIQSFLQLTVRKALSID
jgi:cytochrome P450/NADPH-cytochrome P450 reductase